MPCYHYSLLTLHALYYYGQSWIRPGTSSTQRRNHTTRPTRPTIFNIYTYYIPTNCTHQVQTLSLLSSHYLHSQLALKPSQINTSNIITITIFFPQTAKSEGACDARGTVLSETHYVCGSGCIVLQRLLRPVMGTLAANIRFQMGNYKCKPKLRL